MVMRLRVDTGTQTWMQGQSVLLTSSPESFLFGKKVKAVQVFTASWEFILF